MTDLSLLIRWALVVLGLVYFFTESAIFAFTRIAIARRGMLLATFIYCPSCTGFWIGLGLGAWLWPYGVVDVPWTQVGESGVAAMALGAIWARLRGGNTAWDVEAPLHDHSEPEEARTRRAEEEDRAQG